MLAGAEIVILVPPSAFLRNVAGLVAEHVPKTARIVVASKGIDERTLGLMTDVAAEAMPEHDAAAMCALSGPSFAREVASGLPTDVVVASKSAEAAADVADALHTPMFRVYTSKDPIGVEVGGAMKNVLAIAAGACDGLGLGTNARAALVTRGLSEMARLGVALGGDPLTFMGLSGVGDLILTSTGALSRNRALGMKVAEGIEPAKYLAGAAHGRRGLPDGARGLAPRAEARCRRADHRAGLLRPPRGPAAARRDEDAPHARAEGRALGPRGA